MHTYWILVLTISFRLMNKCTHAVSVDEDLTLSKNEKLALDKFRVEVSPLLPEEYMKEDIYLIRWLRAKKFNLDLAKEMLLENLRWRKANNMSTIHEENWSDMQEDYQFCTETHDKTGRPIASLRFGEWDIRRAILAGKGQRLRRYLFKALDGVTKKVRELQKQGKQVTQWISLLDMDGYSVATHGCFQCLGIYISYVQAYENYFPGSVHDIILVNTPSIFELVLQVTRPLLDDRTKNMLHVFGTNKKQWQSYLAQRIDSNQLETYIGGKHTCS